MTPIGIRTGLIGCFTLLCSLSCSSAQVATDPNDTQADSTGWPVLTGPYLGQSPPGLTPTRFVPPALAANSIWFYHGAPAFSPDGLEMFFVRYPTNQTDPMGIDVMRLVDNRWTEPQRAPFSSELAETNPVFSYDGNRLYYVSERQEDRYKLVIRSGDGWSSPQSVSVPSVSSAFRGWQLSVTKEETLVFELDIDGQYDLYLSRLVDGAYTVPESLGDQVNSGYNDFAPFIHPEEDFIIFTSQRPGGVGNSDLYISFRDSEGAWAPAVNMGSPVNSSGSDAWPYLSPGGEYFFFVSCRQGDVGFNPYWVDAQVIEQLRMGPSR